MHKYDNKTFRFIQNLIISFMQEGFGTYIKQAGKWQEMFEECGADILEMQEKLAEMDEKMEEFKR